MQGIIELNIKIEGRVQGVFFRDFCQEWANALGLVGYAKNLPSGIEVEIIAQGAEKSLQEFLEKIKNGPSSARVKKISSHFCKPQKKFIGFETF
jgi:acylphosphatase